MDKMHANEAKETRGTILLCHIPTAAQIRTIKREFGVKETDPVDFKEEYEKQKQLLEQQKKLLDELLQQKKQLVHLPRTQAAQTVDIIDGLMLPCSCTYIIRQLQEALYLVYLEYRGNHAWLSMPQNPQNFCAKTERKIFRNFYCNI